MKYNKNKAMVIVMVLWIIVILALLALSFRQLTLVDNTVRKSKINNISAFWLARSAVAYSLAILAEDNRHSDSLQNSWYDSPSDFKEVWVDDIGYFSVWSCLPENHSSIVYGLADQAARLNINVASVEQLALLPGVSEIEAQEIIRWRDSIAQARDDDDESPTIHRPIATISQLQWIDMLDERFLFGEDKNLNGRLDFGEDENKDGLLQIGLLAYLTADSYDINCDSQGLPRININSASPEVLKDSLALDDAVVLWIYQNRPYDSVFDLLLRQPQELAEDELDPEELEPSRITLEQFRLIYDKITILDAEILPGLININTASAEVLLVLEGIDAALAHNIIKFRNESNSGFQTVADLLEISDMTIENLAAIADYLTVRSNVFKINAQGITACQTSKVNVQAIVDRNTGRILYIKF